MTSRYNYPTLPGSSFGGRRKPCSHFLRNNCKFGARCRFSHDVEITQASHLADEEHSRTVASALGSLFGDRRSNAAQEGKLWRWKQLLQRGEEYARPSLQIVGQFFSLALELVNEDVGAAQETVRLLATEAGLSFIKDVMDRHISMESISTAECHLWETEIKPLFQLVTHARVVDSAVLETESATIFNYMVGVGGSRMSRLFHYIDSLFQSWPPTSTQMSLIEAADLSLAVLAKMLDCNTTNIIKDDFSTFANSLSRPLEEPPQPEEIVSRLQATKHLHFIRQRIQIGNDISNLEIWSSGAITQETFVLARDLPGHLSVEGPRHDNDQADIANIKILPTYEEIMSPRGEYLPVNDSSQWHIPGIGGRLDREFRLIREDTVGQLRDAIHEAYERIRSSTNETSHRTNNNNLHTYKYDSATVIDIQFAKNTGMDFVVRCDQPPPVASLNPQQRRDWWQNSRRLQAGALVCVIDKTETVMFFTVSESTLRKKGDQENRTERTIADYLLESQTDSKVLTLSDDRDYLYVNLKLVEATRNDTAQALNWYKSVGPLRYRHLLEFPGILLASFKYTLDALKEMRQKLSMPFVDLLAPSDAKTTVASVQPPRFARRAGFTFDLGCLTHDGTEFLVSPQQLPDPKEVESRTSLDSTQSSALLNTLSREFSLIQGPPGTGKSYTGEAIIKVLLRNKNKCSLGPILCVCYTNHALDQLLEHLLDDGISNIIRIGSRSKSDRLQALNLRLVSQLIDNRTSSEKSRLYDMALELDRVTASIKQSLRQLSTSNVPHILKEYLAGAFPGHHDILFGIDEDGWRRVDKPHDIIRKWLAGGSRDSSHCRDLDILVETDLFTMSNAERRELHQHWMKNSVASFVRTTTRLQEQHTKLIEHRSRIRSDIDLRCLYQASIIGVTTTGLAKNIHLLSKLKSKVMLCEEAGEVLEAHILTALLPSIEHAILIGDHLQLRPQIQNYDLQSTNPRGRQYSLDTSLFERLVDPPHLTDIRLPYCTLETQRRMHPSISELIRSNLYPSLQDGENVKKYPAVVGMKERLFWLHHDQLEAAAVSDDPLNTSHSNDFEIEMTVSLLSHLVRQGEYRHDEIAILTPYLGQLVKLRRRMESMFEICLNDRDLAELEDFEDRDQNASTVMEKKPAKSTLLQSVRAATVDNFQGEEAKVIIISLVRSNPQRKCGFLSTSNRINVLLSRAKHGMYIIGNSSTYYNVPMWQKVIDMLSASGRFGPSLCGETCPEERFCQQCATNDIKSLCVDFIEMKEYHEIDLDEEPCIFPDCGHFLTTSSMDGQMQMAAYYDMDTDGHPIRLGKASEPFSLDGSGIPVCANCRGSLRNVARYGRIVRRAMLDESTKKFIEWSHGRYLLLATQLLEEQRNLGQQQQKTGAASSTIRSGQLTRYAPRLKQLRELQKITGDGRYDSIINLWRNIGSYASDVRREEQPFQRVADFVLFANRQNKTHGEFRFDDSINQIKGSLLADTLLLKCDLAILLDFRHLVKDQELRLAELKLDLSYHWSDSIHLIELSRKFVYSREEVQGHIFAVQLCILCSTFDKITTMWADNNGVGRDQTVENLKEEALYHIQESRVLMQKYPSTAIFEDEICRLENMVNDGIYRPLTAEEMQAVYKAMSREFMGTGHWYTCENNHPFTIGECGMPMEEARCPECGARIGGLDHQAVEGMRHAAEIENLARDMDGLGM
ncbi:hypothetical protein FP744_10000078 [Trichoderma asperellum]